MAHGTKLHIVGTALVFGDAVEVPTSTQVDLVPHDRGRGINPIVEHVAGENREFGSVLDDEGRAVSAGDVHATAGRHRRGVDVADAPQPLRAIVRPTRLGVVSRENPRIALEEVQRAAVQKER